MNDRFKGRVWYPHIIAGPSMEYFDIELGKELYLERGEGAVMMLSTGLRDKNGRLIYEGDILAIDINSKHPAVVEWCMYGFDIRVYLKGWDNTSTQQFPLDELSNLQIIGNEYENPELLK